MDIVDKLRADELPGERQFQREARVWINDLLQDAADEIERLRAVAVEKTAEAAAAHDYSVKVRKEIDTLHEAVCEYVGSVVEAEGVTFFDWMETPHLQETLIALCESRGVLAVTEEK